MLNVRLVLKSPSNEGENVILFQTNKTPRCVIYIVLFETKMISVSSVGGVVKQ
jgi:hypothetical protein